MVEDGGSLTSSNDIVIKYLAITATKSRSVENNARRQGGGGDDDIQDENALVGVSSSGRSNNKDGEEEFKESVGV